jgi:phosphatidylethanolamine-binding protein (PEBP) family uncharacterized protein
MNCSQRKYFSNKIYALLKMLQLRIGQHKIRNNENLKWSEAQEDMSLYWKVERGDLYTVIFYDIDAPSAEIFIHYFNINIPGNEFKKGDEIITYMPPNPPDASHRYIVSLFKQLQPLDLNRITRTNFFREDMQILGIELDAIMFTVSPRNTTSGNLAVSQFFPSRKNYLY